MSQRAAAFFFNLRLVRWVRSLERQQRMNMLGAAAFVLALAVASFTKGLPLSRGRVELWATLGVLCMGAGNLRRSLRDLVTRWLPVFFALFCYDLLRVRADSLTARAHLGPQLDFDRWLGGGRTIGERLQAHYYTPGHLHWWDYVAWVVYTSHFIAPLAVGVILWRISPRRFGPYMMGVAALCYAALATYAIYPAKPPWMASVSGHAGPISRVVHEMWNHVGVKSAAHAFTVGAAPGAHAMSNPVAALPSLHAAFPMLIFLSLRGWKPWLTVGLAIYTFAMGISLVYAGEHYIFDVLMGWGYAACVSLVVSMVYGTYRARRRARRLARADGPVVARV